MAIATKNIAKNVGLVWGISSMEDMWIDTRTVGKPLCSQKNGKELYWTYSITYCTWKGIVITSRVFIKSRCCLVLLELYLWDSCPRNNLHQGILQIPEQGIGNCSNYVTSQSVKLCARK